MHHYKLFSLFLFLLEPSLTFENVLNILAEVKDPEKWNYAKIPEVLQIPRSKVREMEQVYPDLSQRLSALAQFWMNSHPAPSWELICYALYMTEEYEVLESVQSKYLKGNVHVLCMHQVCMESEQFCTNQHAVYCTHTCTVF